MIVIPYPYFQNISIRYYGYIGKGERADITKSHLLLFQRYGIRSIDFRCLGQDIQETPYHFQEYQTPIENPDYVFIFYHHQIKEIYEYEKSFKIIIIMFVKSFIPLDVKPYRILCLSEYHQKLYPSSIFIPLEKTPFQENTIRPILLERFEKERKKMKRIYYTIDIYNRRSNIIFLIEQFCRVFYQRKDVLLYLNIPLEKIDPLQSKYLQSFLEAKVKSNRYNPKVIVEVYPLTDKEIEYIHFHSHIYLTTSLGETNDYQFWKVPSKNLIIAPRQGAHIEFLHKDQCLFYDLYPTTYPRDLTPFPDSLVHPSYFGTEWYRPNEVNFRYILRESENKQIQSVPFRFIKQDPFRLCDLFQIPYQPSTNSRIYLLTTSITDDILLHPDIQEVHLFVSSPFYPPPPHPKVKHIYLPIMNYNTIIQYSNNFIEPESIIILALHGIISLGSISQKLKDSLVNPFIFSVADYSHEHPIRNRDIWIWKTPFSFQKADYDLKKPWVDYYFTYELIHHSMKPVHLERDELFVRIPNRNMPQVHSVMVHPTRIRYLYPTKLDNIHHHHEFIENDYIYGRQEITLSNVIYAGHYLFDKCQNFLEYFVWIVFGRPIELNEIDTMTRLASLSFEKNQEYELLDKNTSFVKHMLSLYEPINEMRKQSYVGKDLSFSHPYSGKMVAIFHKDLSGLSNLNIDTSHQDWLDYVRNATYQPYNLYSVSYQPNDINPNYRLYPYHLGFICRYEVWCQLEVEWNRCDEKDREEVAAQFLGQCYPDTAKIRLGKHVGLVNPRLITNYYDHTDDYDWEAEYTTRGYWDKGGIERMTNEILFWYRINEENSLMVFLCK